MRDISADTPLADSIVYANRMANEVQMYFTDPDRTRFTMSNSVSKFEFDLCYGDSRGITYFGDYYGKPYFENSMDMYAVDSTGTEWNDRKSGSFGRQNTYRLGYYYSEAHILDLRLAVNSGEIPVTASRKIGNMTEGWHTHMADVAYGENGITYTVTDQADPYISHVLGETVPEVEVNAIRVKIIAENTATCNLYYYDTETKKFSGEQNSYFALKGTGEEEICYVPLDSLKGDLAAIRFDLNGKHNDKFIITSIEAVRMGSSLDVRTDRIYHIYSDKLHQEFRFVAAAAVDNVKEYGVTWKVKTDTVDRLQIRDAAGTHDGIAGFDPSTVEYVAFHIKDNGVVGIIIPSADSGSDRVTVTETDGFYVVRQIADSPKALKKGASYYIGNRLYNDKNDSFDAIDREARLERNPLTEIEVGDTSAKTKFDGYDHRKGSYYFSKRGTDFTTAYAKRNNNRYYYSDVTVKGDGEDRSIYLDFRANSGSLESATLLDENKMLMPIPVEVCKNFVGEYEERFYDPKDTAYGDSIFPLRIGSGKTLKFTELHLYQNWGVFPLKQISSIQFFIGYYHMSTGVTESNCIAPYFVYGKDGWTLPDFRGASGELWSGQPQFTSVGIHKWLSFTGSDGKEYMSEYTGTKINSYGPAYADIDYSYISDDGSYKYTLRHVEFPQNDENRTYYTISVEFLKDFTVNDFKNDFTILQFNSRDNNFQKFVYLDENGAEQTVTLKTTGEDSKTYLLNKDSFYYCIYDPSGKKGVDVMNYGLILRSADIRAGGKPLDGRFAVRYDFKGRLDNLALTLDEGKVEFKKGDTIVINAILLPFGDKIEKGAYHARLVYEDSVLKPVNVAATVGTVIPDTYVPRVQAENNVAEFTVSGSRNRNTVVVSGFDKLAKPSVSVKNGDSWEDYKFSVEDYDGYQVQMSPDGTYSYSFVYEIGDPSDSITFKVSVGG